MSSSLTRSWSRAEITRHTKVSRSRPGRASLRVRPGPVTLKPTAGWRSRNEPLSLEIRPHRRDPPGPTYSRARRTAPRQPHPNRAPGPEASTPTALVGGRGARQRSRILGRLLRARARALRSGDGGTGWYVPHPSVLRQNCASSTQPGLGPPPQPGDQHHRIGTDGPSRAHACLCPTAHGSGQDQPGDPTLPQALHHASALPNPGLATAA